MNTRNDGYHIDINGMPVRVVRKNIKYLHVGVYPPDGVVRVAAPKKLDDDAVRLAVISRLGWIHRKQSEFESQDRQSLREFVTGESHYLEGRRYRLDVSEHDGPPGVRLVNNKTMELKVRPGSDRAAREVVLHRWYRVLLRRQLLSLIEKWEPVFGERVAEARIKRMKTRWGTCSNEARRIWLNLELAKKPASCTEYILVHEMIHLIERRHNDKFRDLMDRFMPKWRVYRDELNRAPLAHAEWTY